MTKITSRLIGASLQGVNLLLLRANSFLYEKIRLLICLSHRKANKNSQSTFSLQKLTVKTGSVLWMLTHSCLAAVKFLSYFESMHNQQRPRPARAAMQALKDAHGYPLKMFKRCSNLNVQANSFSPKIIDEWNALPANVVLAPQLTVLRVG